MDELNQNLNKSHCDGRMTFVRYEMLRAMRRAAHHAHLGRQQVEDIFHNNAARLIESARKDLAEVLGPSPQK
jgi:glutamate-1-semialdehyde 2,1-aminomutase